MKHINYGSTPLHDAARYGYLKIVRLLLEYGANINAKDMFGKTPLDFAKRRNQLEVVEKLERRMCNICDIN